MTVFGYIAMHICLYTHILTIMVFKKKPDDLKMIRFSTTLRRDAHHMLKEQSEKQERPMSMILTELIMKKYPKKWYHGVKSRL